VLETPDGRSNLLRRSDVNKLHLSGVESNPTTDEQFSDAYLPAGGLLPGYDSWTRFADGEINEAELDAAWVAEQEAQDQLLLDELRGVTDDELIEISQGRDRSDERLRAAVVHELGRRLAEKCGQTRKSA
jgi:hypothetical protein